MKNSKTFTILIKLLQTDIHSADKIQPLITDSMNWTLLYTAIIRHRVWHQAQKALSLINIKPPDSFTENLWNLCERDRLKIIITATETARIAKLLNQANIQYCVLKGVILNALVYDEFDTRTCRDIDIWVDPNQYYKAVSILMDLGYGKTSPTYELKDFKERYYMTHHNDMAFYNTTRKILVELHFKLTYLYIPFFLPTPAMLKPVNIFNVPVLTLKDEHHLLYLIVHGGTHAWCRLRWLHDIALFIKSKRCHLSDVFQLAKQIHCEHVVQQTLILVSEMYEYQDESFQQLIQTPSRRVNRLTLLAKKFICGDYHITDGVNNISMFIKYRYYLVQLAARGKKIRAFTSDVFKIDQLFPYMTFPDRLSFLYYVVYPIWVIKFISTSIRSRIKK